MNLKIYPVIVQLLSDLRPVLARLQKCDPDLARQARRAGSSMVLNTSEGAYSQGRNKRARYFIALGSTREVLSCVEIGIALGYVDVVDAATLDRFQHVLGTLVRLVK
jgi:four helix bundle protein